MRLGLFDPANYTSYHTLSPADVNTNKSQVKVTQLECVIYVAATIQELALKLAQESIVLLQNNKSAFT